MITVTISLQPSLAMLFVKVSPAEKKRTESKPRPIIVIFHLIRLLWVLRVSCWEYGNIAVSFQGVRALYGIWMDRRQWSSQPFQIFHNSALRERGIAKEWRHSETHYWTVLTMPCVKCSWKHFLLLLFSLAYQYKTIFQLCARDKKWEGREKKKREREETRQRGEEKCLFYDMGLSSRTTLNMWLKQSRWERASERERGETNREREWVMCLVSGSISNQEFYWKLHIRY